MRRRLAGLLAGLWAGLLVAVAAIATPAPFALLRAADAGRVVARMLAQEAWVSVVVAVVLLGLVRGASPVDRRLLWGTLGATGLGYFVIQALLPAARSGDSAFSFAQLHVFSTLCYGVKVVLVLALAWRLGAERLRPGPSS